eukprot:3066611-Prymnesium_polylepis.2
MSRVICSHRSPSTSIYAGMPAGASTSPSVSNLWRSSFISSQSPVASNPRDATSGHDASSLATVSSKVRKSDFMRPPRAFESCCAFTCSRSMPVSLLTRAKKRARHLRISCAPHRVPFFSAVSAAHRSSSAGQSGFRCRASSTVSPSAKSSWSFVRT